MQLRINSIKTLILNNPYKQHINKQLQEQTLEFLNNSDNNSVQHKTNNKYIIGMAESLQQDLDEISSQDEYTSKKQS